MRTLIVLALVACAHRATPAPIENARGAALPASGALIRPGEQLTFAVTGLGVPVGSVEVAVGDPGSIAGHRAVIVATRGSVEGLLKMVKYVRADGETTIDLDTGLSIGIDGGVDWGGVHYTQRVRFAGENAEVEWKHGTDVDARTVYADQGNLHGLVSAAAAIRGWNGRAGDVVRMSMLGARSVWDIAMRWIGGETTVTKLGRFPSVRIDGTGALGGTIYARFSVWLTDDSDRVPLRAVIHSDLFDATFDLTSYEPGL